VRAPLIMSSSRSVTAWAMSTSGRRMVVRAGVIIEAMSLPSKPASDS
jgi:hypothetical protein